MTGRQRVCRKGMLFYRLLEQAVQAPPRTYRSLVVDPGSGRRKLPPPPLDKRVRPATVWTGIPSIDRGVRLRGQAVLHDRPGYCTEMEDP
jgi:hypothetical protein